MYINADIRANIHTSCANIYQNNLLKYPLNGREYKEIDNVWKFAKLFEHDFLFLSEYRNRLINTIKNKYTIEQFYFYEKILNKLFWNLRYMLCPLWMQPNISYQSYRKVIQKKRIISQNLLSFKREYYGDEDDLIRKMRYIHKNHYYRSFINKLIMIDHSNKEIIMKPIEGSFPIFSKNYFNLLTSSILFNKPVYEKVMDNPYNLSSIIKGFDIKFVLPEHYYEYDYGFPNLNYCIYKTGHKKDRLKRIEKMYYCENCEKNWFRIIR